jgi:tRNA pseudouridine32 synthase/23S rRNA pseudouridine746 synthase
MRVVFADPWLMVVDKPSGLLSQSGLGPDLQDAVPGRLRAAWGELRLVHRLDRDTSGLLLLARDADAHRSLSRAFAERRVRKTYRADVWGQPAGLWGRIEAPLARARRQPPQHRVQGPRQPVLHHQLGHDGPGGGLGEAKLGGGRARRRGAPRQRELRGRIRAVGRPNE